ALDPLQRLIGKVEQPDQIRDRHAAPSHAQTDLLTCETKFLDHCHARPRLLDGAEVLASHVLDQGDLERGGVVVPAHKRRNRLQPRAGTPTESPPDLDPCLSDDQPRASTSLASSKYASAPGQCGSW